MKVDIINEFPVDIVLCHGDTVHNTSEFEQQLEDALKYVGVDTSRIRIHAPSVSYKVSEHSTNDILNTWTHWGKVRWHPERNGIGVYNTECKRSGYYLDIPEAKNWTDYTLEAKIQCDQSKKTVHKNQSNDFYGFYFRTQDARNSYVVFWEDITGTSCDIYGGQLAYGVSMYCLEDADITGPTGKIIGRTNMGPYESDHIYHWKIEVNGATFTVWIDDMYIMSVTDSTFSKGSIGLMAMCHGGVNFLDIEIQGVGSPDLIEFCRNANWSTDSFKFIVDFIDKPREDFENGYKIGELAERFAMDSSFYVGAGTSDSKGAIQQFIQHINPGKEQGIYLDNNSPEFYKRLAKYILDTINTKEKTIQNKVYLFKDKDYRYSVTE